MLWAKRSRKERILLLLEIALLITGAIVYLNAHRPNPIEQKLVSAIDQRCEGEGECEIDLAEVFADFDWDTVSVFVGGNTAEVMELGVYTEISDGIVFSKAGEPLKQHLSCYGFPDDIPPLVSYYVERSGPYSPYYISFPREQAVVHASKYQFQDGSYKYSIFARNPS